jgi:hypothetical protein
VDAFCLKLFEMRQFVDHGHSQKRQDDGLRAVDEGELYHSAFF